LAGAREGGRTTVISLENRIRQSEITNETRLVKYTIKYYI